MRRRRLGSAPGHGDGLDGDPLSCEPLFGELAFVLPARRHDVQLVGPAKPLECFDGAGHRVHGRAQLGAEDVGDHPLVALLAKERERFGAHARGRRQLHPESFAGIGDLGAGRIRNGAVKVERDPQRC